MLTLLIMARPYPDWESSMQKELKPKTIKYKTIQLHLYED